MAESLKTLVEEGEKREKEGGYEAMLEQKITKTTKKTETTKTTKTTKRRKRR